MKKAEEHNSKIIGDILNDISAEDADRFEKRMLLAAKIDDALKAKNWRKSDLAKALQKEPSIITKWLSGTHNFTADTFWDIERVLEVTFIELDQKPKDQIVVQNYTARMDNTTPFCYTNTQMIFDEHLKTLVKTHNFRLSNTTNNFEIRA
jgi:transcriptional regulator with XRE-family HTH domain